MNIFQTELRQTFRSLLRKPGFSILAVLVLALGLGANLLLFNAVQALLWRPLPFPESQRLVCLKARKANGKEDRSSTGFQATVLWERASLLAETGLVKDIQWDTTLKDHPERRLSCAYVSSGYLRALGLRPLTGRLFGIEEDRGEGGETRAVLTEGAWRRLFGSDPSVLGRVIRLESGLERGPIRIVGIVAGEATLPFTEGAQLLFPIANASLEIRDNDNEGLYHLVARLKHGVTREQASTQVMAVLQDACRQNGGNRGMDRYWLEPLRQVLRPANQGLYLMLLAASALLLLLTAINAASLFLARALERSRETALRLALGAGLAQLLRSQLMEAGIVCGAGLLLAFGLNAVMKAQLLLLLPELRNLGPELLNTGPILLGFAMVLTLLVGLAVILLPMLQARNPHLAQDLGGRSGSMGGHWGRQALITAQVTVILVLLSLGALLTRSLGRALKQDAGFNSRGIQVCTVQLAGDGDRKQSGFSLAPDRDMGSAAPSAGLAELAAAIPGTRSASFTWQPPFGSSHLTMSVVAQEGDSESENLHLSIGPIGPDYFRTLGARMLAGREFTRAEVVSNAPITVLSESAARLLFPGANAMDRTIRGGLTGRRLTVVGVCADLRNERLDEAPRPMVYVPFLPIIDKDEVVLVVRTESPAGAFAQALRERLKTSGAILEDVKPLNEMGAKTVQNRMRAAAMVGVFALLGLCIGCIGLYGTLSTQAAERKREVGIRMALGSTPLRAAGRIIVKGARPVALGALLGLCAALMAAHLVRAQLYGVEALDATSHLAAIGFLFFGCLLALLIPALRAARVNPTEALRSE